MTQAPPFQAPGLQAPDFLDLPDRSRKPRTSGLTHVLDQGLSLDQLSSLLASRAELVDVWKFGWGTGYIDPAIEAKVATLTDAGVRACLGGTLLETAWLQGRAERCLDWAHAAGFTCIEVSNGAVDMPTAEKRRLIAQSAESFEVLAEVGSKDPAAEVSAALWAEEAQDDLEAGAAWILAEGRETGRVGLYEPDGSVRADVVQALITTVGRERVVFEAPVKDQQAWLIRCCGPNVNLGNVRPEETLGLEAMRLGLRADTVGLHKHEHACNGRRL